jgi:hypothetical protein
MFFRQFGDALVVVRRLRDEHPINDSVGQ